MQNTNQIKVKSYWTRYGRFVVSHYRTTQPKRNWLLMATVVIFGALVAFVVSVNVVRGFMPTNKDYCELSVVECKREQQAPIVSVPQPEPVHYEPAYDLENLVQAEIVKQAKAAHWLATDAMKALKIAKCESSLNPAAKNQDSTATGVFQWTNPTWEHIGNPGDRLDYKANIAAFIKHYPKHPEWWECKA